MGKFSQALALRPGVTALIGGGGKTSLVYRLAQELQELGSVIVTTSTRIYPPEHLPVTPRVGVVRGVVCVGSPCEQGKLTAPMQSFEELETLADYVLVEADGSKHLPIKAHEAHEPVLPANARQVICVVGASGLNRPAAQAVHRAERFVSSTGSAYTSPEAVARLLQKEALHHRLLINQAETNEAAARQLGALLSEPVVLACLQKGEILC